MTHLDIWNYFGQIGQTHLVSIPVCSFIVSFNV